MARRVKGGARIRSILRGMPAAFRAEMAAALDRGGSRLRAVMQIRAPRRTGALRQGIDYQVYPRSSRMKVGLLATRKGRSNLFYGRIQDLGRKAQEVRVTRDKRRKPYTMRIKAMTPKRFITGRIAYVRDAMRTELKGIFGRAITRISGGGSDND